MHAAAREYAPETFAEYDTLAARREELRGQIADAQTEVRRSAEAQAPGAAEIADLRAKLEDTTPRLAKKYQARLDELLPAYESFLANGDQMALLTRETPEIAAMRKELMEADFRMRDLAPEVSRAYREAAKDFPEVVEPVRAAEPAAAGPEAVAEPARAEPAPVAATAAPEPAPAAEPARATQGDAVASAAPAEAPRAPINIADDVAAKLRAAGRPVDEAAASAAVVDAYWTTRAARLGEDAGELYRRFGADIRAGGEGGRAGMGQGKITLPAAERAREYAQNRAQVDTPEFKRWFGDSKVVDEAGEPLVVYHGTSADFDAFSKGMRGKATQSADAKRGFFFTNEPRVADDFVPYINDEGRLGQRGQIMPVYLNMRNPAEWDWGGNRASAKELSAAIRDARRAGHDGLIIEAIRDAGFSGGWGRRSTHYIVFEPEQIKSAIGNRGTFDPRDPRIVYQRGRGQAALNEGRAIITLFDRADASTFMHETGHEWLERMIADGADARMPEGMRADAGAVRKWLGMEADQVVPTTRQHERFARAFEQYLREGHAPSRALDGVFAQFRDWLTRIYETIKRLGKPINDDIRQVFDRLLTETPERAVIAPERELVTTKPETPAYLPVPKPPESLLSFLKRKGGLKDTGGDVSAIIGGTKGRPGLINKQNAIVRDGKTIYRGGMELDEAAHQAWEAGYFPDHPEGPDMHAFLRAIEDEARGNHVYSEHDAAQLAEHRHALDSNAEVDRLAFEHGIEPAGLTREQFFDRVAEKVAEADLEADISNAATHVDEFADDARHWYEDYADDRKPRTLEDAEREWRDAEKAAGGVEPRQSGDAGAGRAGGPVQEGQGRAGQGGGGAADGRGAGPAPKIDQTEAPANPNGQFDTPASPLVDKAGNIRIDNLNIPEDVARAIREAADQNGDFIGERRGVVSDSQVLELADALGMTPEELGKRKIGEAYNAEQVMAARKLLVQSATDLRDLARKAAEGREADVIAFAAAKARHRMIQGQVAGITAEAGRALRAFRMLGGEKSLVEGAEAMMRDATGRTLFQMQEEAKRAAALETPAQVSKFARDSDKPGFWDMIAEFWMNSLLSGPQTHMANVIGNSVTAVTSILETGLAAGAGGVRRALGGKGGVVASEAGAELFGLIQGAQDGIKVAGKAFREKDFDIGGPAAQAEMFQFDPRRFQSIPSIEVAGHEVGGKQIRIPSRLLTAEDAFFRSVAYRKSINGQAYRMATQEGLEGSSFAGRVAELTMNPSEAMMAEAVKSASYATFTNELGNVGKAMQQLSNSHIIAKFLLPFLRTPINIAKYALERTPASLLSSEVRGNLTGRNGAAAMDQQIGRLALGTAVMVGIWGLAEQGLVTGSGPDNPQEMAMWRLSGKQPYSVRVGDTWYSVRRFDPLGFLFSLVSDAYEAKAQLGEKPIEKVGLMLANSIGKSFLEGTGMKGLADAVKAISDPDRYGGHWAKSFLSSFYPFGGAAGQVAHAVDPYARQTRTLLDEIKAKTPYLSQSLPPKYDIFGEPIPSREALGPDALSVLYMRQVNDDPVVKTMTRLHIFPGPVAKKIKGVELTPEEYAEFAASAGKLMKMQLDAVVGVRGFSGLPDGVQQQALQRVVESSRETAASMMQMHHPRLITESLDAKRKQLVEGKKPK